MKKQIFVFAALLLAVFFTACQQDALIEPIEDITQVEQAVNPPQEALDALEVLIDSDFAEPELEERCNNYNYGGSVRDNNLVLAAVLCGVRLSFYGGSTSNAPSSTLFYYHVDEKNTSGQYKRIDSGMKNGAWVTWNYKTYSNEFYNSGCKWRAYVYAWNASCGTWKRLSVRYF